MINDPTVTEGPIAAELVRKDPSYTELVNEYVNGLTGRMADMERALVEGDFAVLRTLAHQLKGRAGGYGYPILTKQAAQVEQDAVAEQVEAAQADLQQLKEMVSRVVTQIE